MVLIMNEIYRKDEKNMIFRVSLPGSLDLRFFDREPGFLFGSKQGEIHYIGGTDILPAPLEAEQENRVINDLGTV